MSEPRDGPYPDDVRGRRCGGSIGTYFQASLRTPTYTAEVKLSAPKEERTRWEGGGRPRGRSGQEATPPALPRRPPPFGRSLLVSDRCCSGGWSPCTRLRRVAGPSLAP